MAFVTVVKAAQLVGLDRKTIYRHIKNGRLSATFSNSGERQIDTAELIRAYGEIKGASDTATGDTMPQTETGENAAIIQRALAAEASLAAVKAELAEVRLRLADKDQHIDDLRSTIRLLEHKKKPGWWKFWAN